MTFADTWLWWVLGPAFVVWALLASGMVEIGRGPRGAAIRFSSLRTLVRIRPSRTLKWRRAFQSLRLITVALLLVAIARPQVGRKVSEIKTAGVQIMLVLDTSGSMRALDLDSRRDIQKRRNRLEVVKSVVRRFIEKRSNDQIGMVVFGEDAFTQCPLTLDHGIVATFLDNVQIGMAGTATAIGDGIGTAVKRLRGTEAKSKVIVLLTDGVQSAGGLSPKKAAEIASTFGIKVYTVAAGSKGRAPVIVDGIFGKQVDYMDDSIDEGALREVASITGGEFFRAQNRSELSRIYDTIDALETTEITSKSYMEYDERFGVFVFPALLLLLLEVLVLGTRLRKIP